jgi:hypothetical protein
MTDSNQKGVAHRHARPMPNRRRFDEMLRSPRTPEVQFILPDNNTFGHLDLRSLVDDFDNSGGDD